MTIWPDAEVVFGDDWVIGAHSFQGGGFRRQSDGVLSVVDGNAGAYGGKRARLRDISPSAADTGCAGSPNRKNQATYDPASGKWSLRVDWSGAFPLYLFAGEKEVLFSSQIRPLARSVEAEPDFAGCVWFLREGAMHGRRSFYRGIRRLDAGDVVSWSSRGRPVQLTTQVGAWNTSRELPSRLDGLATGLETQLAAALAGTFAQSVRPALMVSGGWDSRTLAGVAAKQGLMTNGIAYSHGDPESREIQIAARVAELCGLPFVSAALGPAMFDPAGLEFGFGRTENVVFPHWHAAGRRLQGLGVDVVAAGVFGEILGGHYGSGMVLRGNKKVGAVLRAVLGLGAFDGGDADLALDRVTRMFAPAGLHRPWYLADSWWPDGASLRSALEHDVREGLAELVSGGVRTAEGLIEAYISRRRAAHYIGSQLLSCRAVIDVGVPFIDDALLMAASRIPMRAKIHNRLNREILASVRPSLLDVPLAATLVSAGAPLMSREASRWVRKVLEERAWRRHFRNPSVNSPPRYAWANFEFVRGSRCLETLAEDLRHPMWNRKSIMEKLAEMGGSGWRRPAHPLVDMMMKIYTVDQMLR